MNKIFLLTVAFVLLPLSADSGLNDLIKQNVKDADQSYKQSVSPIEQRMQPSRLWIHLRSESQKKVGEEIFKAVSDIKLMGRGIERKPLQFVDFGPRESQLRYFKERDEPEAKELMNILRRLIPEIKLKDFSREYAHINWIKTGHFELWLSPEVVKLEGTE